MNKERQKQQKQQQYRQQKEQIEKEQIKPGNINSTQQEQQSRIKTGHQEQQKNKQNEHTQNNNNTSKEEANIQRKDQGKPFLCCVLEANAQMLSIFKIQKYRHEDSYNKQQLETQTQTQTQSKHEQIIWNQPISNPPHKQEQPASWSKTKQNITQDNIEQGIACISTNTKESRKVLVNQMRCRLLNQFAQFRQESQFQLYREYRNKIVKTLLSKTNQQKQTDFIDISFPQYKKVLTVWANLPSNKKKQNVPAFQFLKFQDLRRLDYGRWLNDNIITAYIDIIQSKTSNYAIYDSLKVASIFSKTCHSEICRLLQKHKHFSTKTPLVFIINQNNHWYFVKVPPQLSSIGPTSITIFNSLDYSPFMYHQSSFIKKILSYFMAAYNANISYKICENYPQQHNDSDCGLFTLCGVKDLVREYLVWSFSGADMEYKRVLVTMELLAGELICFE